VIEIKFDASIRQMPGRSGLQIKAQQIKAQGDTP